MENIENYEGGSVVHLNEESQAVESQDTHEMMEALTQRYGELQEKLVDQESLSAEQISDIEKELNEIEEERARLESTTPDMAA